MQSFEILTLVFACVLLYAVVEHGRHVYWLRRIPIRVHVNGTRGKSSVTRLIGAGLSAGGLRTVVKVTGTFPRLILANGQEVKIHRRGGANILEQLNIVRFAARRHTEALVIECMALDPHNQWVTEHRMIRATLGVITNVRIDHTDVMGETLDDMALSLGNTIPVDGELLTAEDQCLPQLQRTADERGTRVTAVDGTSVSAEDLAGFEYVEHPENVALALAVCQRLGVDRSAALAGMHCVRPDAGALTGCTVDRDDRRITFWNALAANDPDSTWRIWRLLERAGRLRGDLVVLLNTRQDRHERTVQLVELITERLSGRLARILVAGDDSAPALESLRSHGLGNDRLRGLGLAEPHAIFNSIVDFATQATSPRTTVVAIGNMGGAGAATAELFAHHANPEVSHG